MHCDRRRAGSGHHTMTTAATPASTTRLATAALALLAAPDDAATSAAATTFIDVHRASSPEERLAFFHVLLEEFGADEGSLALAIDRYREDPNPRTLFDLGRCAEPRRRAFIQALNTADGGTAAVVSLRAELLQALPNHPELAPVDVDFVHLLGSWFNLGFLTLRRFDWDTPASVLEKLIEYEAVHEIRSWTDLRRRLAGDRRCFAFFHAALPGEPLIFVEVALTDRVPTSIREILDEPPPEDRDAVEANTAVFYSITNCQPGLRGISFGTSLLKRVTAMLRAEFPHITTFVTLSPVPTLMRWLRRRRDDRTLSWLPEDRYRLLHGLDDPSWVDHPHLVGALEPIILRACAEYLLTVREDGRPADPVARFHLGNGALLDRINWLADTSWKGLTESAGILVNYRYDAGDPDAVTTPRPGLRDVRVSEAVRRLAAGGPSP